MRAKCLVLCQPLTLLLLLPLLVLVVVVNIYCYCCDTTHSQLMIATTES
jgi:hypothetical protein